ncbi:hypothetical protein JR316_0000281 [Psilocybe cubensis]|uniref:Uncharacterized protein n=1 Tax=Psilocybe cubensis TaxID=181762 RepID=A0ACB8HEX7_PSICU|nr:hypothetical protein JR316_0000281 [Psilocybe cubensis]KAH9486217.1 hypothetical protein JR316_0000281 [Psilocybe cubensis]
MLGLRSSFEEEEAQLQWDINPIVIVTPESIVEKPHSSGTPSTKAAHVDKGSNMFEQRDVYSGKSFFLPFEEEVEGKVESRVRSVQLSD